MDPKHFVVVGDGDVLVPGTRAFSLWLEQTPFGLLEVELPQVVPGDSGVLRSKAKAAEQQESRLFGEDAEDDRVILSCRGLGAWRGDVRPLAHLGNKVEQLV